eukprot:g74012.t1
MHNWKTAVCGALQADLPNFWFGFPSCSFCKLLRTLLVEVPRDADAWRTPPTIPYQTCGKESPQERQSTFSLTIIHISMHSLYLNANAALGDFVSSKWTKRQGNASPYPCFVT